MRIQRCPAFTDVSRRDERSDGDREMDGVNYVLRKITRPVNFVFGFGEGENIPCSGCVLQKVQTILESHTWNRLVHMLLPWLTTSLAVSNALRFQHNTKKTAPEG